MRRFHAPKESAVHEFEETKFHAWLVDQPPTQFLVGATVYMQDAAAVPEGPTYESLDEDYPISIILPSILGHTDLHGHLYRSELNVLFISTTSETPTGEGWVVVIVEEEIYHKDTGFIEETLLSDTRLVSGFCLLPTRYFDEDNVQHKNGASFLLACDRLGPPYMDGAKGVVSRHTIHTNSGDPALITLNPPIPGSVVILDGTQTVDVIVSCDPAEVIVFWIGFTQQGDLPSSVFNPTALGLYVAGNTGI